MPAHLITLLLLANPLLGGGAVESSLPSSARQAASSEPLLEEFEALRAAHSEARRSLEGTPGIAQVADEAYRAPLIELSLGGSGRATAWLLRTFPLADTASRAEIATRLDHYAQLARDDADRAWLLDPAFDLFGVLVRDAERLGQAPAIERAEAFARTSTVDETRAAALGAAAQLEGCWTDLDPDRRARARARHDEVLARFPGTAQAAVSRDALWRLSRLAVGKVAPSFITRDVDGNEIRLDDLRRRVLVVEFWSTETPGARTWAAHRRSLVERHVDERFFLLGVCLDRDAQYFRRACESLEVDWTNAFEVDPTAQSVWRVAEPGSNLVLDSKGVVRFVNVHGAALDAAVASLIEEFVAPAGPGLSTPQKKQGGATRGR